MSTCVRFWAFQNAGRVVHWVTPITQRKIPYGLPDEERLTEDIIALTRDYGRYGYRMITRDAEQ